MESKTIKETYIEWYNSRPEDIKALIDKYPPGLYEVIDGAPYTLSCSGQRVIIFGYRTGEYPETCLVKVIIPHSLFCDEALENIRALCEKHNKSFEEFKNKDIVVEVDPIYLKLIKLDYFTEDGALVPAYNPQNIDETN